MSKAKEEIQKHVSGKSDWLEKAKSRRIEYLEKQLSEAVELIEELEGHIDPLRDPKIALKIKTILSKHTKLKQEEDKNG